MTVLSLLLAQITQDPLPDPRANRLPGVTALQMPEAGLSHPLAAERIGQKLYQCGCELLGIA
ncbi:MAG TPA: hypothetical protein VID72_07305, partial [Ktedonobacterales bacterium]